MTVRHALVACIWTLAVMLPLTAWAQQGDLTHTHPATPDATIHFGVLATAPLGPLPCLQTGAIGGPADPCAFKLHHLTPEEATILKSGEVTFQIHGGGHSLAIYEVSKDTTRDEIGQFLCPGVDPTTLGTPGEHVCNLDVGNANASRVIVDGHGAVIIAVAPNVTNVHPDNRVWDERGRLMSAGGQQLLNGGTIPAGPTSNGQLITYRFLKTGRYLVICANRGHFINDWMFGFVNVVSGNNEESRLLARAAPPTREHGGTTHSPMNGEGTVLMPRQRSYARMFLVAMVLLTAACGSGSQQLPGAPSPPPPSSPPPLAFSISGVVTEQTSSGVAVLEGVRVGDSTRSRLVISNAAGAYRLFGMIPGPVQIHIDHSGFEPVTREVMVTGDTVLDFQLVRRAPGSLSGRITEDTPNGPRPVAGVAIEVVICPTVIPGGSYTVAVAKSDADGFYNVLGLCSGETAVFLYKPGYFPPNQDRPCEGDGAVCVFVTISGDTRSDFILTRVP